VCFKNLILLIVVLAIGPRVIAQDSTSILQLPQKYLTDVSSKAHSLEEKMDKKSEKVLNQMMKQEARIAKKLSRLDSVAAVNLVNNTYARYKQLEQKLTRQSKLTPYMPKLDSLATSL
jgi:hypothetical protein